MLCTKCGQEYEGSQCPRCDGPVILVNNSDYLARRKAYEEKQALKERSASSDKKEESQSDYGQALAKRVQAIKNQSRNKTESKKQSQNRSKADSRKQGQSSGKTGGNRNGNQEKPQIRIARHKVKQKNENDSGSADSSSAYWCRKHLEYTSLQLRRIMLFM